MKVVNKEIQRTFDTYRNKTFPVGHISYTPTGYWIWNNGNKYISLENHQRKVFSRSIEDNTAYTVWTGPINLNEEP